MGLVELVDEFVVNDPSLAADEHLEPPVAVSRPSAGQVAEPQPKIDMLLSMRTVIQPRFRTEM
ncbi:MAG: hypothetical protein ACHQ50_06160 [Fimbriimonadales bacterium]